MAQLSGHVAATSGLIAFLLLASDPAHALRCKSKVIREGMVESEVIRLCGEPVSRQDLGYVVRSGYRIQRGLSTYRIAGGRYGYGYHEELIVTEMLFNFGPRKLMRRIRFEGGRIARIETAGYGYIETDR
ncbi:MAG: DUF2845 domain-containing protein [Gammaproteobacteria bacterium]|nr:DUF2845 domain-containing protein [Gammaproteobacteria bacterium]